MSLRMVYHHKSISIVNLIYDTYTYTYVNTQYNSIVIRVGILYEIPRNAKSEYLRVEIEPRSLHLFHVCIICIAESLMFKTPNEM